MKYFFDLLEESLKNFEKRDFGRLFQNSATLLIFNVNKQILKQNVPLFFLLYKLPSLKKKKKNRVSEQS